MAENSAIEWTTHTFNPWIGCAKVSQGCTHCYAETLMDTRYGRVEWGIHGTRVRTSPENWRKPHQWNRKAQAAGKRARVFCASLADVFEDREELKAWRRQLFGIIGTTPWLDWLLLTKRPENMVAFAYDWWRDAWPANVWAGTSVESQAAADERIPHLRQVPAAIRFLSCEPLLGPLDLGDMRGIHWAIVGGESGHGARPFDIRWAVDIKAQCHDAGVACFIKQLGANPILDGKHYPTRDSKGGDMAEWPAVLRVGARQFPAQEVTP